MVMTRQLIIERTIKAINQLPEEKAEKIPILQTLLSSATMNIY